MEQKYKLILALACSIILSVNVQGQQDSTFKFSLQQCIDYAKANNPQIKAGVSDMNIAKADVKEITAIGLPHINAGANFTHNLKIATQVLPDFISPSVYGVLYREQVLNPSQNPMPQSGVTPVQFGVPYSLNANATLSQMIFDGSFFVGLKAANEYVNMSKLQTEKTEVAVVENVTKSYLLILTSLENKKLAEDNLVVVKRTMTEMKALFDNGFAEKLDVERIELSKLSLEIRLKSIDNQVSILKQSLQLSMGMDVNQKIEITDSLNGLMASGLQPNTGVFDVKQLPDYKILNQNQTLQEINLKRYRVGRYPSVRLNANYGQQSFAAKGNFGDLGKTWFPASSYTVAVNIPIWDGNTRKAQMIKVQENLNKNEIQMANVVNASTLQYNSALNTYNTNLELMDLQKQNLKIAEEIYKKASIKLKEGLGSSLELVQADADYKSAQVGYLNSVYDVLISNLELKKSIGQLK